MKYIFLLLVVFLVKELKGQSNLSPGKKAENEMNILAKKVGLDSIQKLQVKSATFRYYNLMEQLKTDTAHRKMLMVEYLKEYRKAIKNVLSPDQYIQYKAIIDERKALMRARMQGEGRVYEELSDTL
jgi:hypothetical protein